MMNGRVNGFPSVLRGDTERIKTTCSVVVAVEDRRRIYTVVDRGPPLASLPT